MPKFYGREGKKDPAKVHFCNMVIQSGIGGCPARMAENYLDDKPRTQKTLDYHYELLEHSLRRVFEPGYQYNPFWKGHE